MFRTLSFGSFCISSLFDSQHRYNVVEDRASTVNKDGVNIPGLDKIPIRQMLFFVVGICGAGPVDKIQIHITAVQVLQTTCNTLFNTMVPRIIQLGGHPDVLPGYTTIFDAQSHFSFIAICKGGVDMSIATLQGDFDGVADFIRLRLPCSKTNGRNTSAGVELEGLP